MFSRYLIDFLCLCTGEATAAGILTTGLSFYQAALQRHRNHCFE